MTYNTVGQTISYSYLVTNTGNVTLSGPFTVSDNKATATCPATASLAPGASITCTASYTITQADLNAGSVTNVASATNGTVTSADNETVIAVQGPALTLSKTARPTTYGSVGTVITYTLVATNSGNVTLSDVYITDPLLWTLTCTPPQPVTLAPGATLTCTGSHTVTQADLTAGSVPNTATVTGAGPQSQAVSATGAAVVVRAAGPPCACDHGTPVCQAGAKNRGTECYKSSDCLGSSADPGTGSAGDLCNCTGGSCLPGTVGNRDDVPDACRSNCMLPMCGDGVPDPASGEQCDDGANNGPGKPCYGHAPNSVCSNATGAVIYTWGTVPVGGPAGHNPDAMISCTTDGQCAPYGAFCRGNPQCRLNTCGDGVVCADPACATGSYFLSPGLPGPEQCDDGNTSNLDACMSYDYSVTIGAMMIPDSCAANVCGDGATNMGVEECDLGLAICLDGPKATKPCATNADCMVGNVMGTLNCSGAPAGASGQTVGQAVGLPSGPDNADVPNSGCRTDCRLPFCGDGISDNLLNEGCDDGILINTPGQYCNTERRCIGGENGCTDANDNGQCDADVTENASRLTAPLCGLNPGVCVKGTCGKRACVQNTCGDRIVAGHEMCDDGNTVDANASTDICGVNTAAWIAFATATGCSTTVAENLPGACPPQRCMLPFCGDGVTQVGEMCDGGVATCSAPAYNAGGRCSRASQCKNPPGNTSDLCATVSALGGGAANRDDVRDACRSNCMPPVCGDGVSDTGEACEPPLPGTFCIRNALGRCVLNTCGDGDVCNTVAIDVCLTQSGGRCVPGIRQCVSGPAVDVVSGQCAAVAGGPEQCDDGNTVNPSPTTTDTCTGTPSGTVAACCASRCGDGVTNPILGEQCDATDNGCSNGREDLSKPEIVDECCYDGNTVDGDMVDGYPGLISVERTWTALLNCRMPNLLRAAACDKPLTKQFKMVQAKLIAAQVAFETDDLTRARRLVRRAERQLYRTTRRITRVVRPGKACAAQANALPNMTANAAFLTGGIVAHLTADSAPFRP